MEEAEAKSTKLIGLKFPRLPLKPGEEVWLNAAYSRLKEGKKLNPRELYVELLDKIPQDFEYERIDERLVSDRELTLLGILHVDPTSELAGETDRVIQFHRELIKKGVTGATSEHVSEELGLPEEHVAIIFGLIRKLGNFWNGLSPHPNFAGYSSIRFEAIPAVREYLNYKGLEPLLESLGRTGEEEEQRPLEPPSEEEPQFVHSLLDWKLGERLDAALDHIHGVPADEVSDYDTQRLTKTVERFAITPPIVQIDHRVRDEKTIELVDETFDRKTGNTGHSFLIPVEGEAEWFQEIGSQKVAIDNHPLAFLDEKRSWIYIRLTISPNDPEGTLKFKLDQRLVLVEEYAAYVSKRVIEFNKELAQRMTEDLNKRKAAIQKAKREAENLGLPQRHNPKNDETAIQIGRLMESLNKRLTTPLNNAEQLYEEAKALITNSKVLDFNTAKLVIEKTEDALKEFGNTNQEKKVELREWKLRAESVLPPKNFKDFRERTEGGLLAKAWRRPSVRKGSMVLVVLLLFAGGFLFLKKTISSVSEVSNTNTDLAIPSPSASLAETPHSTSSPLVSPSPQEQALTSSKSQAVPMCIHYEESKSALDGPITIGVGAISYEGVPLRHFVDFAVNSTGHKSVKFTRKVNGDRIVYRGGGTFEVIIVSIDAINACFDVRKLD